MIFRYLMRIIPLPLLYIVMFPVLLVLLLAYNFFRLLRHKYKKKKRTYIFRNITYFLPEKSWYEKLWIVTNNFLYYIFFIIDMLKAAGMNTNEIKRRIILDDHACEQLRQCIESKQAFVLLIAHFGHWEWLGMRISIEIAPHTLYSIYMPIHNKLINKLVFNIRNLYSRPFANCNLDYIHQISKKDVPAVAIVTDYSPGVANKKYWGYFLGREIALPVGIHRIPKLLKAKVFFVYCKRERLGYYSMHMKQIAMVPHVTVEDILPAYLHELGKLVRKYPEQYLWAIIKRNYTRRPDENVIDFNSSVISRDRC